MTIEPRTLLATEVTIIDIGVIVDKMCPNAAEVLDVRRCHIRCSALRAPVSSQVILWQADPNRRARSATVAEQGMLSPIAGLLRSAELP